MGASRPTTTVKTRDIFEGAGPGSYAEPTVYGAAPGNESTIRIHSLPGLGILRLDGLPGTQSGEPSSSARCQTASGTITVSSFHSGSVFGRPGSSTRRTAHLDATRTRPWAKTPTSPAMCFGSIPVRPTTRNGTRHDPGRRQGVAVPTRPSSASSLAQATAGTPARSSTEPISLSDTGDSRSRGRRPHRSTMA